MAKHRRGKPPVTQVPIQNKTKNKMVMVEGEKQILTRRVIPPEVLADRNIAFGHLNPAKKSHTLKQWGEHGSIVRLEVEKKTDRAWIWQVETDPEIRKQGHAKRNMINAIEEAKGKGVKNVLLFFNPNEKTRENYKAVDSLYKELGFVPSKENPTVYILRNAQEWMPPEKKKKNEI